MRVSQINAVPMAMVTTLGLLLLMSSLINVEFELPTWSPPTVSVDVVMPKTEVEPPRPLPPERPADPVQPPPPIPITVDIPNPGTGTAINIAPPTTITPSHNPGVHHGDLMPIVQVAPQYPRAALTRGLEGYVTLSFTVTTTGRTRDPVVVNAITKDGTPTSVFDRAAIAAVQNFRYSPQIENGVPVEVHNVRTRLVFELAN
ncbi:energy transducer TonB [Marinimicrobium sp. ABcell2]|uniref:energy transducer TonB n=1 Tax=Marinimicrobium sp. ABcell2 TaxID=3069751 RepID=UPI0027B31434|nr:energy transducer TonB [Marinimicrobium sp. ABcell2]MDQ2077084.1 energy transducer TonB [Marinimicrobium sp. ABcell2]